MTSTTTPAAPRPFAVPAAPPAEAVAHFSARLAFFTDVADVAAAFAEAPPGGPGFVLVDSRSAASWEQGHVPGAVHLPTGEIPARAAAELDPAVPVVTYCWGPGCDGATRAALALARLGFAVKEMLGGMEYWIREGLPTVTPSGVVRRARDPLTGPVPSPVPPSPVPVLSSPVPVLSSPVPVLSSPVGRPWTADCGC